jgi:Fe-S-cluster containining protein
MATNRKAAKRKAELKLDCTECGLCCMAGLVVDLTKRDEERLGAKRVRLHVIQPRPLDMFASILDSRAAQSEIATRQLDVRSGPLRGSSYEACVFLRGIPLKSTKCHVYEDRPSACRDFKPGSAGCFAVRQFFMP